MKTLKEFLEYNYPLLSEEIHKEISDIMNDDSHSHKSKLSRVSSKMKELVSRGEDSGIENSTPKKGSSRAVFFPTEHKHVQIDGHHTTMRTAVKIAFPGSLDKHTGDSKLLGEHQNELESDHFVRNEYGMLHEHSDGHFSTNHHGVLAPVIDNHHDHHWLEMGHAENITNKKFSELTKTESHPKGLNLDKLKNHLMNDYNDAHGKRRMYHETDAEHEHMSSHPLVEHLKDFIHNTGQHPADLDKRNWGVWKHPVTGKEHPVIRDYGYSDEVGKLYQKARKNKYNY